MRGDTRWHAVLAAALREIEPMAQCIVPAARIAGRVKSLRSALLKSRLRRVVLDRVGIRVIVTDIEQCYRLVTLLHWRFVAIAGEYDDYISAPKPSGYRSLHTTLLVDEVPVEVQVRTGWMHLDAESGAACHRHYKDRQLSSPRQGLETMAKVGT